MRVEPLLLLRVVKQTTINVPLICADSEERGTKNASTDATGDSSVSHSSQLRGGDGDPEAEGEEGRETKK